MTGKQDLDMEFADLAKERAMRLYYLRKTILKISREKFAKKHDIPAGSIQNWEDIRYGGLTENGAFKLLKAFQNEGIFFSIDWLLYGRGEEPYIETLAGPKSLLSIRPMLETKKSAKRKMATQKLRED